MNISEIKNEAKKKVKIQSKELSKIISLVGVIEIAGVVIVAVLAFWLGYLLRLLGRTLDILLGDVLAGDLGYILEKVCFGVELLVYAFATIAIVVVLFPAFRLGLTRIYFRIACGENISLKEVFSGFDDYWSEFKRCILERFFSLMWMLSVFGIGRAFSFAMSKFVLAERRGEEGLYCINGSKDLAEGYKKDLTKMYISLFGLYLLCIVTLGIAYIWVGAYVSVVEACAYKKLQQNLDEYNTSVYETAIADNM